MIKELVVHPDLRRRDIAGFMLGRLMNLEYSNPPTEMVFDTSRFKTEEWLIQNLVKSGFRHQSADGSPAIWLPGRQASTGQTDMRDPHVVAEVIDKMPPGWNGYFFIETDNDPRMQVYHDGLLVGASRRSGRHHYDEEMDTLVADYTLSNAAGEKIGVVSGTTREDALRALLNNYDLCKPIVSNLDRPKQ